MIRKVGRKSVHLSAPVVALPLMDIQMKNRDFANYPKTFAKFYSYYMMYHIYYYFDLFHFIQKTLNEQIISFSETEKIALIHIELKYAQQFKFTLDMYFSQYTIDR